MRLLLLATLAEALPVRPPELRLVQHAFVARRTGLCSKTHMYSLRKARPMRSRYGAGRARQSEQSLAVGGREARGGHRGSVIRSWILGPGFEVNDTAATAEYLRLHANILSDALAEVLGP